jgi:hypothetical protein
MLTAWKAGTAFRASGLVPLDFYAPKLSNMTNDEYLAVYSDMSLAPEKMVCESVTVGTVPDSCIALTRVRSVPAAGPKKAGDLDSIEGVPVHSRSRSGARCRLAPDRTARPPRSL